jgi:hypothetical protein
LKSGAVTAVRLKPRNPTALHEHRDHDLRLGVPTNQFDVAT